MKRFLLFILLSFLFLSIQGQIGRYPFYKSPASGGASTGLLTNLVAAWRLEETSGTSAEDSKGSNDGTITGCTINQTGKIGQCYSFDGTDHINMAEASSDLIMYDQDFTFAAWIYPTTLSGTDYIVILGGMNSSANMYIKPTSGTLKLERWGIAESNNTDPDIAANEWSLVVITFNSSATTNNVKLYKNNASPITATLNQDFGSGRSTNSIGWQYNDETYPFVGLIDEVLIWKGRILSDEDVLLLWNDGDGLAFTSF